jgi:hypothetical protein
LLGDEFVVQHLFGEHFHFSRTECLYLIPRLIRRIIVSSQWQLKVEVWTQISVAQQRFGMYEMPVFEEISIHMKRGFCLVDCT